MAHAPSSPQAPDELAVTTPPFEECPPQAATVTDYDERHFVTYLRLLEAAKQGADWREVAAIIFGIDSDAEPARAKAVHDNHLARARWMTQAGYRDLLARAARQRRPE